MTLTQLKQIVQSSGACKPVSSKWLHPGSNPNLPNFATGMHKHGSKGLDVLYALWEKNAVRTLV